MDETNDAGQGLHHCLPALRHWARPRQICQNKYQLLGKDPVVHHRSWFGYRNFKSLLLAVVVSLVLVTGSLQGPLWAGEN